MQFPYLKKNCYFTVGNNILKQNNTSLVSACSKIPYNFHSIGRFIDDLCVINDKNSFFDNFKDIYPKELELKLEHQGSHATFLGLDIEIRMVFLFKLFDKRDAFSFEIIRMPFIDSNIPSNIFYGAIFSEILQIIRCTLKFEHLKPRLESLFRRMINQGATKCFIFKQIKFKPVFDFPFVKFLC